MDIHRFGKKMNELLAKGYVAVAGYKLHILFEESPLLKELFFDPERYPNLIDYLQWADAYGEWDMNKDFSELLKKEIGELMAAIQDRAQHDSQIKEELQHISPLDTPELLSVYIEVIWAKSKLMRVAGTLITVIVIAPLVFLRDVIVMLAWKNLLPGLGIAAVIALFIVALNWKRLVKADTRGRFVKSYQGMLLLAIATLAMILTLFRLAEFVIFFPADRF